MCDELKFLKFGVTCWAVWEDRNKMKFNLPLAPVEYKSKWILRYVNEIYLVVDNLKNREVRGSVTDEGGGGSR